MAAVTAMETREMLEEGAALEMDVEAGAMKLAVLFLHHLCHSLFWATLSVLAVAVWQKQKEKAKKASRSRTPLPPESNPSFLQNLLPSL